MAERIGGVARLLERTQHKVRQNALFGLASDLADEALVVLRRDAQFATRERDAHGALASLAVGIGSSSFRGRGDTSMTDGNLALVQILNPERIAKGPGKLF